MKKLIVFAYVSAMLLLANSTQATPKKPVKTKYRVFTDCRI